MAETGRPGMPERPDAGAPTAEGEASGERRMPRIARAGATLAAGTLVSRILGFVSQAVLSWAIGTENAGASAFAIANTLPNNIFLLISGGLLSAVLVPQIVRAASHADGGDRFVGRLLSLAVVVFAAVTLVAVLAAPLLVRLYASSAEDGQLGSSGIALATAFAYWCLPQIFFYALYSLLGEVLNARGVFGPITWVPAINNVVAITASVVFVGLFGRSHVTPESWGSAEIAVLAGGATLGIIAQTVGLILFWRRTGLRFRPGLDLRGVGLGGAGRAALWTFGMLVVNQVAGIVQTQVASLAVPGDPSVRSIQIAWLLFILPHSLITMSIATPYFTRMSAHAHAGDLAAIRGDLSDSLRTVVVLVAGAGTAIAVAAIPLGIVQAQGVSAGIGVAAILLAYLIALVPFSALFLVQRTFFALGDTRTPFFVQLLQGLVFAAGAVVASRLPSDRIAVGIALATSFSLVVQLLVSLALLRRRTSGLDGRRILSRVGVFLALTAPAAAAGVGLLALLGGVPGLGLGFATASTEAALLSAASVGGVTGIVYLALLALTRSPELRTVLGVLRRRS